MYDPDGSDTDREWLEVFNETSAQINLTEYKFFEANTNHGINGIESFLLSGEYALVVQDINKFKTDFPTYTGKIFTSSFSLSNSGEPLAFKNKEGVVSHEVNYTSFLTGSNGGKTLNFNGTSFSGGSPTPGTSLLSVIGTTTTDTGTTTATTTQTTATTTQATSTQSATETVINPTGVYNPVYTISRPWPIQDKIYVNAGENRKTIVGVENLFEGKALGSDKKPALNASFNWSFGDGYTLEGQKVTHVYKNTGEYTVVLEVYSNGSLESDKIYVKVESPDLQIKIVDKKIDGKNEKFVELTNSSVNELKLSEMQIRTVGETQKIFQIPKNFSILGKRTVLFEKDLLGFDTTLSYVSLEYINGKVIGEYGSKDTKKNLILGKIEKTNDKIVSTTTTSVSIYTKEEWEQSLKNSQNKITPQKTFKKISPVLSKTEDNSLKQITTKTQISTTTKSSEKSKIVFETEKKKYFWQDWLSVLEK
jgi:hypothetical protein